MRAGGGGMACAHPLTGAVVPVQVVAMLGGVGPVAVAISAHPARTRSCRCWWPHTRWPRRGGAALAALVLTDVRGRSGWARAAPRFSELALWAVLLLVLSGMASAVIELGSVTRAGHHRLWLDRRR